MIVRPDGFSSQSTKARPAVRPLILNGVAVAGSGGESLIYYPGDHATEVGVCQKLAPEQIEQVELAALQGFEAYRHSKPTQRAEILERLARKLEERQDELARLITMESGKPIQLSRGEVRRAVRVCRDYAYEVQASSGRIVHTDGRVARVQRFPLGPVLAITPYNFPLNLVVHKLAPAIAAGCSITIKPAPQTPLTALLLGELAVEAGYPAISVIPADNDVAETLVRSEAFAKLSFTGSAKVGWHLKSLAGKKSVTLELGGNAACIIESLPQPVEDIAARCAFGAFTYSGQTCISVQRLLVNHRLLEQFLPAFVAATRAMRVGDPLRPDTDIGPIISMEDIQRIRNIIKDAIFAGANVVYGGNTYNMFTMNPTILDRTTPDMRVNTEECFAPIVTIAAYKTFDEALALVNDSRYGLQAGLYTTDLRQAERAYQTLEVGGLVVNDIPTYRADLLPYGGVKDSGLGREGVMSGIEDMTYVKTLILPE